MSGRDEGLREGGRTASGWKMEGIIANRWKGDLYTSVIREDMNGNVLMER